MNISIFHATQAVHLAQFFERDVNIGGGLLAGNALHEQDAILAELQVLLPLVLQHRFAHEHCGDERILDLMSFVSNEKEGLKMQLTLQLSVVEERKLVDDLVDFLASAQTNKNLKTFKRNKCATSELSSRRHDHGMLITLQASARIASASVMGVFVFSSLSSTCNSNK